MCSDLWCTASETILPRIFTGKKTDAFLIIQSSYSLTTRNLTSILKASRPLCFEICHLTDILMLKWQQILSTCLFPLLLFSWCAKHRQNKHIKRNFPHTLTEYHRLHAGNSPNAQSKQFQVVCFSTKINHQQVCLWVELHGDNNKKKILYNWGRLIGLNNIL